MATKRIGFHANDVPQDAKVITKKNKMVRLVIPDVEMNQDEYKYLVMALLEDIDPQAAGLANSVDRWWQHWKNRPLLWDAALSSVYTQPDIVEANIYLREKLSKVWGDDE
jgi:hypothetical protein